MTSPSMPVKVLIADDAEEMRKAIRRVLENEREIQIVGEAANRAETIQLVEKLKPHVVVMDLRMPNDTRITPAVVKAHLSLHGARLLAISFADDEESKASAKEFGALRLLDKMNLGSELISAIKGLL